MGKVRFNQLFVTLICASFLSAFVLPGKYTSPLRSIQGLFAPVAWPAHAIASSLRNRLTPPSRDDRSITDIKTENDRLRALALSLQGQLDEMRRINQEREALGDIRGLCTPFRVIGSDPSANRRSLAITATIMDHVSARMPVVYANGLVGRIERVGPGGAQVQLITDSQFQAQGRFYRFRSDGALVALAGTPPFLRGDGEDGLIASNIPLKEVVAAPSDDPATHIAVGDYAVLDDPGWPQQLRHQVLGRVQTIGRLRNAPLYAEIHVQPVLNLWSLTEVMVMNRK